VNKIRILLFACNPRGTDPLDLQREFREIDEEIRLGEFRDALELIFVPGTRPVDLLRKLNEAQPQVVHFSSHGTPDEIYIESGEEEPNAFEIAGTSKRSADERDMKFMRPDAVGSGGTSQGPPQGISKSALVSVLGSCDEGNLRLIVMNACHSRSQAEALAQVVDCVVSMNRTISDRAAIKFAASFYGALAFGRSVQKAFDQGVARLNIEDISEADIPELLVRTGVNASALVLVGPSGDAAGIRRNAGTIHHGLASATMHLPFWNVPYPRNPFFTGRDKVVAELWEQLSKGNSAPVAQVITGLGGIGKTQTAVEYAHRYRDKYKAVLWLNADSTPDLKAGYGELARQLQLPHEETDLDQSVHALLQWLATQVGWLLVFDNADDPALLKSFIPTTEHGHILLTSRANDFQDLGIIKPVELRELPVEDATSFLLSRCHRQEAGAEERDAAERLAGELDGLPLALEQAAAYIAASKGTKFRSYLESYQSEGLKRLEARHPALGKYPRSVVSTWIANFDAVEKESRTAADVLRLSSFLAPDTIPFGLLTKGASELGPQVRDTLAMTGGDPLVVNDLLQPLGRFSLIRIDGHAETFSIHRVVQDVLRDAMHDTDRRVWAERTVRAVNRAFPMVAYCNWPSCGRLLPHALAVAYLIKQYRMEFPEAGQILHQVAVYLRERGQYGEVEPLFLQAMEIRRAALGEHHPDYAESLNDLAELYREMGRFADAEPLYERAAEIRRTALGEYQPGYAESLNDLAELYSQMGRLAEAEPLYERAAEIRRTALGEHHPDYAESLNDLAELYKEMGRFADAEPLYERAAEIRRTALGEHHPDYAESLNNLAILCYTTGRLVQAETLYVKAAEIVRTTLGERHPRYATTLNNLAGLYSAMGYHAQAEPLYERAVEVHRTALGDHHPGYAAPLNNLAGLYVDMGRHAEAEALYLRAIKLIRATLGERHPRYATTLKNLSMLYRTMGRIDEAQSLTDAV
jgi:tetratricopeptide (TPR) repeat protein